MKVILLLLLFLSFYQLAFASYTQYTENQLLLHLDSLIEASPGLVAQKQEKIKQLRKRFQHCRTLEEEFWLNKLFYEEYYVFKADSAMRYATRNIQIAKQLLKPEQEQEWRLNTSFLLAATGLLKESAEELKNIDVNVLSDNLKLEYWDRMVYLYSHLGQYIGPENQSSLVDTYYSSEQRFKEEMQRLLSPENPNYYSYLSSFLVNSPDSEAFSTLFKQLQDIVEASPLTTRQDAINAYSLACMYKSKGDKTGQVRYLIYSAIADVRCCNRDIASLEELSAFLYDRGDIDRGYTYINYCLNAALLYPNRVRMVGISSIMEKLHQAYLERNQLQEMRLRNNLWLLGIMFIILIIALVFIVVQFRKIKKSKAALADANRQLSTHVDQLSAAHEQLAQVNSELQSVNAQLTSTNNQLLESNYVKEEYIGYVFSICSSYISKLEEFRKNVSRKMKAGQFDEVKQMTAGTTIVQSELKEFYHSFDALFLHVYPDFVDDFNALLRPEEQIVLKEGELLNTELRIYALVRLGINDSVKIADFLHCSPQTVYNNRLRTRNKAVIPKENFAEVVRSLGKMQK